MATEKEVSSALKQLMDYFTPKDMSKDKIDIYRQQLQRLDGDVLERAIARCLTTLTWMPKLNEIFAIAAELPVEAKVPNLLRATAFELEYELHHSNRYDAKEWQKLADSYARLDCVYSSQRILERMEAISAPE